MLYESGAPFPRSFEMPPLLAQLEFPDGIDWKAPQENTGSEQNRRTKEGKEGEREPKEGGRNVYKHSGRRGKPRIRNRTEHGGRKGREGGRRATNCQQLRTPRVNSMAANCLGSKEEAI